MAVYPDAALHPNPQSFHTRIPDSLASDLRSGELTFPEYALLIFMVQSADKNTGILVSNSRILANQLSLDWRKVANILASLSRKGRIITPFSLQRDPVCCLELKQEFSKRFSKRRGTTKPYPISFQDATSESGLVRGLVRGDEKEQRIENPKIVQTPVNSLSTVPLKNGTNLAFLGSPEDKNKENYTSSSGIKTIYPDTSGNIKYNNLRAYARAKQGSCRSQDELRREKAEKKNISLPPDGLKTKKSEEEIRKLAHTLNVYFSVRSKKKARELAENYPTVFIHNTLKQIKLDFDRGMWFRDSGWEIIRRIEEGASTPDFDPEGNRIWTR